MDSPNSPPRSTDAAIVELEQRLTFQQRLLEELNGVVLAQQKSLDALTREVALCRAALDRVQQAGPGGENLPYEKPPHY